MSTDLLINQTKTWPQGTIQFKLTKQMDASYIIVQLERLANYSSLGDSEVDTSNIEVEWMIGVTDSEVGISVFVIIDLNNRFASDTPAYWENREIIRKLDELLEHIKVKEIKSHVGEVHRRGIELVINIRKIDLSDLDDYTLKKDKFRTSEILKLNDLKDMITRLKITHIDLK